MNKCFLQGYVTADPTVRTVVAGRSQTPVTVANFTIAVRDRYDKDENGNYTQPATFFRVAAWRGLGDMVAKYVKKGRNLLVTGAVSMNSNSKGGITYHDLAVRADDIVFCDRAPTAETPTETPDEAPAEPAAAAPVEAPEEFPFY